MSDEILSIPANPQIKPPTKQNLIYLALFEDNKMFLATKFEPAQFCVKMIGFFLDGKKIDLNKTTIETFQEIMTKNLSDNKEKFMELNVSFSKLQYVRNLMFRQK